MNISTRYGLFRRLVANDEAIFLLTVFLFGLFIFIQSFALDVLSMLFPLGFSIVLLITSGYLLSKQFSSRVERRQAVEMSEVNEDAVILFSLISIHFVVSWFSNLTVGTLSFITLFVLVRHLSWRGVVIVSTVTIAILYLFINIIGSPII